MFTSMMMAAVGAKGGDVGRYDPALSNFYILGGANSSLYGVVNVVKINASTLANANLAANLAKAKICAVGLSTLAKAYSISGYNNSTAASYRSNENLTYSSETTSVGAASITDVQSNACGLNAKTTGFFFGGLDVYGPTWSGRLTSMSFADETFKTESNSGTNPRGGYTTTSVGAVSTSSGYAMGFTAGSSYTADVGKLNFSSKVTSLLLSTLNSAKTAVSQFQSDSTAYAYAGASSGNTGTNDISGLSFATDTKVSISATAAVAIGSSQYGSSSSTGYVFGGYSTALGTSTAIHGLNLSNNTAFSSASTLGTAKRLGVSSQV